MSRIGSGAFANVYQLVGKTYNKHPNVFLGSINELNFMAKLKHENLVELFDFTISPDKVVIYMDVGNDIITCQYKHTLDHEIQLIAAVRFIHKCGFTHNDIKPSNVLYYRSSNSIKLCDFNLVMHANYSKISIVYGSIIACDPVNIVRHYKKELKPAQNWDHPYYHLATTPKANDIWGLGVTLHFMQYKTILFYNNEINTAQLHKYVTTGVFSTEVNPSNYPYFIINPTERCHEFDKGSSYMNIKTSRYKDRKVIVEKLDENILAYTYSLLKTFNTFIGNIEPVIANSVVDIVFSMMFKVHFNPDDIQYLICAAFKIIYMLIYNDDYDLERVIGPSYSKAHVDMYQISITTNFNGNIDRMVWLEACQKSGLNLMKNPEFYIDSLKYEN